MRLLRFLYTAYAFIIFTLGFIILMPFFLILIQVKGWHKYVFILNNLWARFMFFFLAMPVRVEYRQKLKNRKRYVFVANHFSYLDIPLSGLVSHRFIFIGKNSMEKIPIFGYVYGQIHITVDRDSLKSKYNTLVKAREAIDRGKSVFLFPEGGIKSKNPPRLAPFKEGAFRLAIEKQIPIVPVTIPYNWIILPDHENLFRWRRAKLICHEPIPTEGLKLDDLDDLRNKAYSVIEKELQKIFPQSKTEIVE